MSSAALLLALLITAAVAAGFFAFARRRGAAEERLDDASAMMSVPDAAAAAYEIARSEGMTIAWVAENAKDANGPAEWFAQSLVKVVPAYRKSGSGFERSRDVVSGVQSLYIRKRDFQTYIDWARGMQ